MQVRATWAVVLVLLVFAGCGSDEAGDTQVAVSNGGTASIDAVVSDGDTVAASTTSSFQLAAFGSVSALTVSVGNVTSTANLTEGRSNVINIGADGKVSGVSVPVSSGSEGGGS